MTNIHVFINDGQRTLLDNYFKPTLKDNWNLIVHELPNYSAAQDFGTNGFKNLIFKKVEIIYTQILNEEEKNSYFIVSDVDIQFFKSCDKIIKEAIVNAEIVFQNEGFPIGSQDVNTGFICMKVTPNVRLFWEKIYNELCEKININQFVNEQFIANKILRSNDIPNMKWTKFNDSIWAWSNPAYSPHLANFSQIHLHHANVTMPQKGKSSLELKIKQLDQVSNSLKNFNHPYNVLKRLVSTYVSRPTKRLLLVLTGKTKS